MVRGLIALLASAALVTALALGLWSIGRWRPVVSQRQPADPPIIVDVRAQLALGPVLAAEAAVRLSPKIRRRARVWPTPARVPAIRSARRWRCIRWSRRQTPPPHSISGPHRPVFPRLPADRLARRSGHCSPAPSGAAGTCPVGPGRRVRGAWRSEPCRGHAGAARPGATGRG